MSEVMPGTLYLVPTPIGNLSDMTKRAADILADVDIVACEDTRHTRILLSHLGLEKAVVSYHEHNKETAGPKLIEALSEGKSVAQVSDAGMPVISDPGADLVKLALAAHIPVVPLPGPNAALTALVASGLDARQFLFVGFLPRTSAHRKELLETVRKTPFTLIFYEAPHRLKETLKILSDSLGDRRAVTARELTKKFETFTRATLSELLRNAEETDPRGEYVLLVEGYKGEAEEAEDEMTWREEAEMLAETLPIKEAARQVAAKRNLARRDVYQFLLKRENQN
jgi:16S rRNA (cytidine1402-2'-O)-methyltransferase